MLISKLLELIIDYDKTKDDTHLVYGDHLEIMWLKLFLSQHYQTHDAEIDWEVTWDEFRQFVDTQIKLVQDDEDFVLIDTDTGEDMRSGVDLFALYTLTQSFAKLFAKLSIRRDFAMSSLLLKFRGNVEQISSRSKFVWRIANLMPSYGNLPLKSKLYDVESPPLIFPVVGQSDSITRSNLTPLNTRIRGISHVTNDTFAAFNAETIALWRPFVSKEVTLLDVAKHHGWTPLPRIRCLVGLPDNKLLSAGICGKLCIWDLATANVVESFYAHDRSQSLYFADTLTSGDIVCTSEETVMVLNPAQKPLMLVPAYHTELHGVITNILHGVWGALELPDATLVSWGSNEYLYRWDLQSGRCIGEHKTGVDPWAVSGALVLADQQHFATYGTSGIFVYDIKNFELVYELSDISTAVIIEISEWQLVSSDGYEVIVWDLEGRMALHTLQAQTVGENVVTSLYKLNNGKIVVNYRYAGTAIWDLEQNAVVLLPNTYGEIATDGQSIIYYDYEQQTLVQQSN